MVTAADSQGAEAATPGDTKLSSSPTPRRGRGSLTRLPKGALAPDKTTTKTPRKTATATGKGRRTTAPGTKRAYTRRTDTPTVSPLNQLLSHNGFSDLQGVTITGNITVSKGRKQFTVPGSILSALLFRG